MDAGLVGTVLASGKLLPAGSRLALASVPVVLAASWAGDRIARRLNQQRFGLVVSGLLVLAGIVTVSRVWG